MMRLVSIENFKISFFKREKSEAATREGGLGRGGKERIQMSGNDRPAAISAGNCVININSCD